MRLYLQTQKTCAAVQLHSCCISGVVENVNNLATPNTYLLGNFQMASAFIATYCIVKVFIKYIYTHMCISVYVSSFISLPEMIYSVKTRKTLAHKK